MPKNTKIMKFCPKIAKYAQNMLENAKICTKICKYALCSKIAKYAKICKLKITLEGSNQVENAFFVVISTF